MTELQTNIISVAVYPDRARVTRSGTVTLEPGSHRLEVSELPLKTAAHAPAPAMEGAVAFAAVPEPEMEEAKVEPSPANLFDGDEFVGTTKLELAAPNGELELYLGTDDRVRVERELKRRDVDKK